jgi:hypothetical protein
LQGQDSAPYHTCFCHQAFLELGGFCGKDIWSVKVSSYLYAGISRIPASLNSGSFFLVSQKLIRLILLLIVIVVICHEFGLNRPVSASPVSSKTFQSSLRPFGSQFQNFFLAILSLFILVTCRSRFDMCLFLVSDQLVLLSALLKLLFYLPNRQTQLLYMHNKI